MKKIPSSTICWSADVDAEEIYDVITEHALPIGTMIKLDQVFFEKFEKDMITTCQDYGYPVFVDRKISEIPEKALQIAEIYLEYKPFMLNVMAGICSTGTMSDPNPKKVDALKRFADLCAKYGTKSCAVTVLTSKTPEMVSNEFGGATAEDQVEYYAALMVEAGFTDIVCSPKEVEAVISGPGKCLSINTPGVRLAGTDIRDQARVTTPVQALDAGATRLVIGSNLTDGKGNLLERLRRNYAAIEASLREGGYEFES